MAIHVEHVGVLERAREVSRLEDIITEDNEDIEAEMPKMGMILPVKKLDSYKLLTRCQQR